MGSSYKTEGVYKRGASNINLTAWGGGGRAFIRQEAFI